MEFEWDEDKNEENFAKDGFDFEHAIQMKSLMGQSASTWTRGHGESKGSSQPGG